MDKVLTTREAAQRLGVSLRTIQLWVENGVLRAWKTAGGHRRIAKDSVEALLREKHLALEAAASTGPFRILVVEDDPDILQLYRLTIASWELPADIITATNGFEGLIRLGQFQPDVLITDLLMPNIDGLEMIRILRSDPKYKDMQIIAVSSLDPREVDERGGLPHDIQLFPKPIPFDDIETIVRRAFEQRGRRLKAAAR
jgi:excisionase family DNA binding protein